MKLTPMVLRSWFKKTGLLAKPRHIADILNYCVSSVDDARNLVGCGICRLSNGNVTHFLPGGSPQYYVAMSFEEAHLACHFKNDFILEKMQLKTARYLADAGVVLRLCVAEVCRMIYQQQEQRLSSNQPKDLKWVPDFWSWCSLQKDDDLGELLNDVAVLPFAKPTKPNSKEDWEYGVKTLERYRERNCCILLCEQFDSAISATLRFAMLPLHSTPGLERFVHAGSTDGILNARAAALASSHSRIQTLPHDNLRALLGLLASENAGLTNASSKSLQDVCLQLPFFTFCKEGTGCKSLWSEQSDQIGFAHLQIVLNDISEGLINALKKSNMQSGDGKFLLLHETRDVSRFLHLKLGVRQIDRETFLRETVCPRLDQHPSAVQDELMEEILEDDRLVPREVLVEPGSADSLVAMLYNFKFIWSHGEGLLAPKDILSPSHASTFFPSVLFPKLPVGNMCREANELVLSKISRLGLRNSLNTEEIIFVAEHVAATNDVMLATTLLPYLAKYWYVDIPPDNTLQRNLILTLRGIRWLPAMKRPMGWFDTWKWKS